MRRFEGGELCPYLRGLSEMHVCSLETSTFGTHRAFSEESTNKQKIFQGIVDVFRLHR